MCDRSFCNYMEKQLNKESILLHINVYNLFLIFFLIERTE